MPRPKKELAAKASRSVAIRLTPAVHARLVVAAGDVPLAEWCRTRLELAIVRSEQKGAPELTIEIDAKDDPVKVGRQVVATLAKAREVTPRLKGMK